MEIFNRLEDVAPKFRGGVLSIGKFDGLHLGHSRIMAQTIAMANRKGAPSVVFTFSPAPVNILRPESAPAPLVNLETKRALIAQTGVDALVEFPTTRDFLNQSADDFFRDVVSGQFAAVGLVEGASFSFGKGREGRGERLVALAEQFNVALELVEPIAIDGIVVSSSQIRRALDEGDVRLAARLLGRRHKIVGPVAHGERRGRTLGFPTANLDDPGVFLPQNALYAAIARLDDGTLRPAAVNLGGNPTFGVERRKIEAHLLDFSGDLYGRRLSLEFCAKLRDVVRFPDKESLLRQMSRDVEETRRIVEESLAR